MNDHFHSDVSVKIVGDNLKLQSSVKNVFKNEEILTGEDGRDSELRIRTKRNVSELVGEYAMLIGEARKLLRVEKIDFR